MMHRVLLAALLLALAAGTADARHRRHHGGFFGMLDEDRGERYGRGDRYRRDEGERFRRDEPAFGERYGREGRDRYGRDRGRDDATTGFGGVDRYRAARRGIDALVPADWQLQPPDPRWTGRRYLSPEGNAWLALYSASVEKEPREAHIKKVVFAEGEELTYLRREPDWVVASGLKGDRIFYRKAVLACGGWRWRHIAFEYPADQKRAFDPLVTRAARALDQGDGEDCTPSSPVATDQPSPQAEPPPAKAE